MTDTRLTTIVHPGADKLREQLGAIEMDVLTSYTLADAIREGASVTEQATGEFYAPSGSTCTLAAAHLAAKVRGYL